MRLFRRYLLASIIFAIPGVAHAQLVNHCRPDGAGGFICKPEQQPSKILLPLTPANVALIRRAITDQIPAIPYTMTPDEMTDKERNGGTATNEERIAQPGSQLGVCESRLSKMGYAHVDYAVACAGLSVRAPSTEQQAAFDRDKAARFQSALDEQRKRGEALRDEIAKSRAGKQ